VSVDKTWISSNVLLKKFQASKCCMILSGSLFIPPLALCLFPSRGFHFEFPSLLLLWLCLYINSDECTSLLSSPMTWTHQKLWSNNEKCFLLPMKNVKQSSFPETSHLLPRMNENCSLWRFVTKFSIYKKCRDIFFIQ